MKSKGLELICDDGEFETIIGLYNKWNQKNMFLSSIPLTDKEWIGLENYCIEHKEETARFFLKMVDCYEEEFKRGELGSPYVGFITVIINKCFGEDDMFPKFEGFVPGDIIQSLYIMYVKWYLKGCPKDENPYLHNEEIIQYYGNRK